MRVEIQNRQGASIEREYDDELNVREVLSEVIDDPVAPNLENIGGVTLLEGDPPLPVSEDTDG